MIEASVGFGLRFGQLKIQIVNGVELGHLLNHNGQKMHRDLT